MSKKLIYGIGVNDADYNVRPIIDGKEVPCPYFRAWRGLLRRCYHTENLKIRPTYKDCTVCDEWLYFSNFRSWMASQDWQGNHLDKDIISVGNKIYSPEFCAFVGCLINQSIRVNESTRGILPIGVYLDQGKYKAQISKYGVNYSLGRYNSMRDASETYKKEKISYLTELSKTCKDKRVSAGLLAHAECISENKIEQP